MCKYPHYVGGILPELQPMRVAQNVARQTWKKPKKIKDLAKHLTLRVCSTRQVPARPEGVFISLARCISENNFPIKTIGYKIITHYQSP
jgi:hypothetical protein